MSTIEKGRRVMTLVNVFTVKPENQSPGPGFGGSDREYHEDFAGIRFR